VKMTHGDCANVGQCELDGVEKSNGGMGGHSENANRCSSHVLLFALF